jgi:hypothetical protein
MEGYYVCCTICGSLLNGVAHIDIGSNAPGALRRRRKIVAQQRQARAAQDHVGSGPWDEGTETEDSENEEGWLAEDEDHSYDPDLVTEDSLKWLSASRCLGSNSYASSEFK